MIDKKLRKYGKSKKGNYEVIDTIGAPHPYCITPKHLQYSDTMYLDIEGAEAKGAVCDICKKANRKFGKTILTYKEHEQALPVACHADFNENKVNKKELHQYLLSIKAEAEKDKFAGFAFIKKY